MNDAAMVARQVRVEQKQFWRNPASAVFAVVFPVMFLVIFGSLNRDNTISQLGGISYDQYYIPSIVAFGIVGATFTNLAVSLSIRRDSGVLKRLRGTPLPTWAFMAGVIGNAISVALLLSAVTIGIGVLFYGVHFQGRWLGLIVDVVVGALCFCSLGMALSTLIPNGDAAPAITNFILFPVVFISGTFFYIDSGNAFSRVADYLPLRHFISTVFAAFDPAHTGVGANWRDLLVMCAWGAGGALVALRRFRWEPARS